MLKILKMTFNVRYLLTYVCFSEFTVIGRPTRDIFDVNYSLTMCNAEATTEIEGRRDENSWKKASAFPSKTKKITHLKVFEVRKKFQDISTNSFTIFSTLFTSSSFSSYKKMRFFLIFYHAKRREKFKIMFRVLHHEISLHNKFNKLFQLNLYKENFYAAINAKKALYWNEWRWRWRTWNLKNGNKNLKLI